MPILKGGVTIETGRCRLVYSEDPAVTVPAHLEGCGWVPHSEAQTVGPDADIVTAQALSPAHLARYRDLYRAAGVGTATLEALRLGVAEAVYQDEKGRRVTVRGKGAAAYVEALSQQAVVPAELLAEVIHRLSRGEEVASAYPFARRILGVDESEPEPTEEDAPADGATFPGPGDGEA